MPKATDKPKTETPPSAPNILVNPNLPNAFADRLQLLMRSDSLAVLRWLQDLPEGSVEVSRVVVTQDHLKRIIDLFCRQTGYYPAAGKVAKD
jgi:hypothetical protein